MTTVDARGVPRPCPCTGPTDWFMPGPLHAPDCPRYGADIPWAVGECVRRADSLDALAEDLEARAALTPAPYQGHSGSVDRDPLPEMQQGRRLAARTREDALRWRALADYLTKRLLGLAQSGYRPAGGEMSHKSDLSAAEGRYIEPSAAVPGEEDAALRSGLRRLREHAVPGTVLLSQEEAAAVLAHVLALQGAAEERDRLLPEREIARSYYAMARDTEARAGALRAAHTPVARLPMTTIDTRGIPRPSDDVAPRESVEARLIRSMQQAVEIAEGEREPAQSYTLPSTVANEDPLPLAPWTDDASERARLLRGFLARVERARVAGEDEPSDEQNNHRDRDEGANVQE